MMRSLFYLLSIFFTLVVTSSTGQDRHDVDSLAFGNLYIYSDPIQVKVEIPAIDLDGMKNDSVMMIEFLPPGRYQVKIGDSSNSIECNINIKPYRTLGLLFNLRDQTVKVQKSDTIIIPKEAEFEVPPSFPGGEQALMKFLAENIQYPDDAKEKGISGRVIARFIIEKDGSITNIEIIQGLGGGCSEEVKRLIKLMPKWNPALMREFPVSVTYNLPVKFTRIYDE